MSGPTENIRTAVVGGTAEKVRRARVVYLSGEHNVLEMSTNLSFPSLGVAAMHTRNPPGTPFDVSMYAGNTGDEIEVYENGATCYAEAGGTVTAGKYQTVDSTARIVDIGGSPPFSGYVVFKSEENATSAGQLVRGLVVAG